ncbi:MAG TPA: translation initiation factor IF-2 N-terminal domain-containing protein, partial [Rubrobacter sp.]|nr:translation initiation factor IF-2 N-terminal domain-containing protein [Rubrobacter sp.]
MSKRVYEIAREQSLKSKEVIQRLKEAGVQVKSHSSSVEDNVYERVFGAGPSVETPNGRS